MFHKKQISVTQAKEENCRETTVLYRLFATFEDLFKCMQCKIINRDQIDKTCPET